MFVVSVKCPWAKNRQKSGAKPVENVMIPPHGNLLHSLPRCPTSKGLQVSQRDLKRGQAGCLTMELGISLEKKLHLKNGEETQKKTMNKSS